ncbi:hypothetical protein BOTBODRAFT_38157 [Botryobasidium botryosum FD-172 SS1]|uniref:Uncharacterized protein n=1 Tax=Botryobasidium botryosum (strain FD-172 SS1) TaxID=930990 RepID=A0A067M0G4_BOTB1|nr:hypothetical protein BOTBODRAFT_38157 [Botryobasidium botryosum FD-172 SS1]
MSLQNHTEGVHSDFPREKLSTDTSSDLPQYVREAGSLPPSPAELRRARLRRGARILGLSLLAWTFFSVLGDDSAKDYFYTSKPDEHSMASSPPWEKDVNVNCNTDISLGDKLSYKISTSSPKIVLYNHGPIQGRVDFVRAQDEEAKGVIGVEIAFEDDQSLFALPFGGGDDGEPRLKVCTIGDKDEPNPWGIGVCAGFHAEGYGRCLPRSHHKGGPRPSPPPPEYPVQAHITVTLPSGPLDLQVLITLLRQFNIAIEPGVLDGVSFKGVKLATVNAPISAYGLVSNWAELASANAPIEGTFLVDHALKIATANAPINANVTLSSEENPEHPTSLNLAGANAPITSFVNLRTVHPSYHSLAPDAVNGAFVVKSATAQASQYLVINEQPLNSDLHLESYTSNGPTYLELAPEFEGKFQLATTPGQKSVVQVNEDREDPSGEGRKRLVNQKSVFGFLVEGSVVWAEEGAKARRGSSQVKVGTAADDNLLVLN